MTGSAYHAGRLAETAARRQQLVLVAMHIHRREIGIANGLGIIIIRQRIARPEIKNRALFGMNARMTYCAYIQPLPPGQRGQRRDMAWLPVSGAGGLPGRMASAGSMTALAIDAKNETAAVKPVHLVKGIRMHSGLIPDIGGVTFETIGGDGPAKPDAVGREMRAPCPRMLRNKIGYGEFVNLLSFPIKIGLRLSSRPDDDVESVCFLTTRPPGHLVPVNTSPRGSAGISAVR